MNKNVSYLAKSLAALEVDDKVMELYTAASGYTNPKYDVYVNFNNGITSFKRLGMACLVQGISVLVRNGQSDDVIMRAVRVCLDVSRADPKPPLIDEDVE